MSCKDEKKKIRKTKSRGRTPALLSVFCLSLVSAFLFSACGGTSSGGTSGSGGTGGSDNVQVVPSDSAFSDRDRNQDYDEADAVRVTLADGASSTNASAVTISGDTITFTGAGTFVLVGALTNGQLIVDAGKYDKVELVFAGVNVNCDTSAALYVKNADKVFVTLKAGTENVLSNKEDFIAIDDNKIDGVVFAKDDLCFKGAGGLKVAAAYGHGIVGKDDVKITGGTYEISAKKSGINANDSVCVGNGKISIESGKDGIHAENDEGTGYIYIQNGEITIDSGSDGMESCAALQIDDGTIGIEAESKGLKAAGDLAVNGGKISVVATDDAVHSNGNIVYAGGETEVSTSDDGFHADETLTVNGGKITVTQSYEGLEGSDVKINGGEIDITASDDGVNVAGGNDQSGFGGPFGGSFGNTGTNHVLSVAGGIVKVVSSAGDGVDSNGSIEVSGGTLLVCSNSGGNSCLDSETGFTYTGGTVIGIAPRDSMWSMDVIGHITGNHVANTSMGNVSKGSTILVCDGDGNVLAAQISAFGGSLGMVYMGEELSASGSYSFVIGATYDGTLDRFGFGTGGTYTGGTSVSATLNPSSSGGNRPGGPGGPGGRW